MTNLARLRTLRDWIYFPTQEETVCVNHFHEITKRVFDANELSSLDPFQPDPDDIRTKVASLMKHELILLGGDVIYVREGNQLHTLGDSIDLLAYYMHTDAREARKAADLLETNFQGYFPITDNLTRRNAIEVINGYLDPAMLIDLNTLEVVENEDNRYAEFGSHRVNSDNVEALGRFFPLMNQVIGEDYFFEKTMMYHFNQPYREKSHVLVGGGGNGKSMFMGLVSRLFGDRALVDAPQPKFTGHDAAVISYNFIGKQVVTFNDVGDPSTAFLEWLKRMITGNLEVKTPSGSWLSIPCNTNFLMETNHTPEVLDLPAHKRRFIIREFPSDFKLIDELDSLTLDLLGDRGTVNAGDIIAYMMSIKDDVKDWRNFDE